MFRYTAGYELFFHDSRDSSRNRGDNTRIVMGSCNDSMWAMWAMWIGLSKLVLEVDHQSQYSMAFVSMNRISPSLGS